MVIVYVNIKNMMVQLMGRFKKKTMSNIFEGIGSVLNLFPERVKHQPISSRLDINIASDADSIAKDWENVGKSFEVVIDNPIVNNGQK